MAAPTDIIVIPHLSPRIIKIRAPITTISIQDLTDQIKTWEDEPANLSYPNLVLTSGKESLGGGVSVGITAELQNAKVMFEARTESDAEGTYTGPDYPDSSNTILIDDNALFTYAINPGDSVINMTTGAVATILSIDSPTQITHEPLDDGDVNYWSYGDEYKIWNKIQCEINGGNLVAVDDNGDDISPLFVLRLHLLLFKNSKIFSSRHLKEPFGLMLPMEHLEPHSRLVRLDNQSIIWQMP
jgi:hypothetical protein